MTAGWKKKKDNLYEHPICACYTLITFVNKDKVYPEAEICMDDNGAYGLCPWKGNNPICERYKLRYGEPLKIKMKFKENIKK